MSNYDDIKMAIFDAIDELVRENRLPVLSIRDQFAIEAMNGMLVSDLGHPKHESEGFYETAEQAYIMADCMLRVRIQKKLAGAKEIHLEYMKEKSDENTNGESHDPE